MPNEMTVLNTAPPTFDHVIGQKNAMEMLKVHLAAYFNDRTSGKDFCFGHTLVVGPSGVGKTLTAEILARELAVPFVEVTGDSLGYGNALTQILLGLEDNTLLFIDESHAMESWHQVNLLRAVESRQVFLTEGRFRNKPEAIDLVPFTLMLGTTDEYALSVPLRQRMKIVLRLQHYQSDELLAILQQRARALHWEVSDDVCDAIAGRSQGTPRLALRLLENAQRVARSMNQNRIGMEHFQRTLQLEQLDSLGCDVLQQQLLRLLAEMNGMARLGVLAARIGLPPRTVSDIIEPFLVREGLLEKTSDGQRALTQKGWSHLNLRQPNQ